LATKTIYSKPPHAKNIFVMQYLSMQKNVAEKLVLKERQTHFHFAFLSDHETREAWKFFFYLDL